MICLRDLSELSLWSSRLSPIVPSRGTAMSRHYSKKRKLPLAQEHPMNLSRRSSGTLRIRLPCSQTRRIFSEQTQNLSHRSNTVLGRHTKEMERMYETHENFADIWNCCDFPWDRRHSVVCTA